MDRICSICGKKYFVTPSKPKDGKYNFCSLKCKHIWYVRRDLGKKISDIKTRSKIECSCRICNKVFYIFPSRVKDNKGKFCSHFCNHTHNLSKGKNKDTKIERKIEAELLKRNISFKKQHPIPNARTIPDFFIKPNICIYADGFYWHNRSETKALNKNQNFWLTFLGYKVYRFWDKEINKSAKKCIDKVVRIEKLNAI